MEDSSFVWNTNIDYHRVKILYREFFEVHQRQILKRVHRVKGDLCRYVL